MMSSDLVEQSLLIESINYRERAARAASKSSLYKR
jgi:hypothetical protein